ncbi:putative superoxide dismutase copper chaperone Lys7 [Tirmania nivea]|nr:putative superoxide dismutase copper chaperone Lys7 [Tirmania nivea]
MLHAYVSIIRFRYFLRLLYYQITTMISSFQTIFATHMTCESCVKSITGALTQIPGVENVTCNLNAQLVTVNGTAAPSKLVSAIQSTGRDAILRGSGDANSAAVCILETHCRNVPDPVRGLARMVQVSPEVTIIDLTLRGLPAGTYSATIRKCGDISRGAETTGGVWEGDKEESRGRLGTLEVGSSGIAGILLDKKIAIWELIGRSMIVSRQKGTNETVDEKLQENAEDTVVGVIARSAGAWENDKTVCSCSGKTIWDERRDHVEKGMI